MTTIIKYLVVIILTFLLSSCQFSTNFSSGVKGNGNVETVERPINDFNQIKVSRGLDVYLTQADEIELRVQADENLHDIIMTKVENNILHIYADENIGTSSARKVLVNFINVNKISSTSGAEIFSTNTFKIEDIELKSTSGSQMEIDITANVIECNTTSGSQIKLSGTANKLYADATSGSSIKADNLQALVSDVKATSGASIRVNASEELIAKATSGAGIKYEGNPEKITKNSGVSGSIKKQ